MDERSGLSQKRPVITGLIMQDVPDGTSVGGWAESDHSYKSAIWPHTHNSWGFYCSVYIVVHIKYDKRRVFLIFVYFTAKREKKEVARLF